MLKIIFCILKEISSFQSAVICIIFEVPDNCEVNNTGIIILILQIRKLKLKKRTGIHKITQREAK